MAKRRTPMGLPDFAWGIGAAVFAVFGACWTIAAIVYKQPWYYALIGIFICVRGTMRAIENSREAKEEKARKAAAEERKFTE